jgi:hypothetical protein
VLRATSSIQTTASVGLQTFLPSALNTGFRLPLVLAATAVTAYLLGSTAASSPGASSPPHRPPRRRRRDRSARRRALLAIVGLGAVSIAMVVPVRSR